ncbi:MAG: GNAT family N-acetyltransferase [Alphaproteobacteria bacterium]
MSGVRPANAEDATSIARVHVDTWRATYAGVVPDEYLVRMSLTRNAASWSNFLARPAGRNGVFVADHSPSGVVGFVSCGAARAEGLPRNLAGVGEVYALYVWPDYQELGLGRELLAAAFDHLSSHGHDGAVIWVLEANPSRFFYEAMGGRRAAERMERFAGTDLAELAYAWEKLVLPARGVRADRSGDAMSR